MPRVRLHHNQLTLRDELRKVLGAADEDELDADLVEGGVLLKPSPEARWRLARERIRAIQERVRLSPELEALSPEELEEVIVEEVRAYRRGAALERIHRAQAGVRPSPELAAMSPEEAEQAIAEMLAADKADEAARRRRG